MTGAAPRYLQQIEGLLLSVQPPKLGAAGQMHLNSTLIKVAADPREPRVLSKSPPHTPRPPPAVSACRAH